MKERVNSRVRQGKPDQRNLNSVVRAGYKAQHGVTKSATQFMFIIVHE